MSKKARVLIVLAILVAVLVGSVVPFAQAQDPVVVQWYIGLGTGAQPEQQEAQQAVIDAFNESHDDIQIEPIVVENNVAKDTLATLIASGQAPDIVGPAGFEGANAFRENWLPLDDLVEAAGYDLTQFPEASVEVYRGEEGLIGLPFATYPSFLYYRPGLFDEAGLEYPPAAYGEPYILDGEEVEWNMDTMREVGLLLTVDANGNDATSPDFDSEDVVQWGFVNQYAGPMRQNATLFGGGSLYEDNGDGTYTAVFPDHWRTAFNYMYDAIWTDGFIPSGAQEGSDLLSAGNPFASGNVAMANSHLWYGSCCLPGDTEWDAAALPSYEGTVTARLHGDTFRILKESDNPEAAFEVMQYLTGEAALDLLQIYGGMPARPEEREGYFSALDEAFPQGVNWDVAADGLNYVEVPQHEEWLPNFLKSNDRINAFWTLLQNEPGLDVDAEIDTLVAELQAIYDEPTE